MKFPRTPNRAATLLTAAATAALTLGVPTLPAQPAPGAPELLPSALAPAPTIPAPAPTIPAPAPTTPAPAPTVPAAAPTVPAPSPTVPAPSPTVPVAAPSAPAPAPTTPAAAPTVPAPAPIIPAPAPSAPAPVPGTPASVPNPEPVPAPAPVADQGLAPSPAAPAPTPDSAPAPALPASDPGLTPSPAAPPAATVPDPAPEAPATTQAFPDPGLTPSPAAPPPPQSAPTAPPAAPLSAFPPGTTPPPGIGSPAASLPPDDEDILDIRGPIHIEPASSWLPWTMGTAGFLALLFASWKFLRRPGRVFGRPLYLLALEKLDATRPLMLSGKTEAFSHAVSETVRNFIEQALGVRAAHRTTEEFLRDLMSQPHSPLTAHRDMLASFLNHCDLAKFARWSLAGSEMEALLSSASSFITAIGKTPPPARP